MTLQLTWMRGFEKESMKLVRDLRNEIKSEYGGFLLLPIWY